MQAKLEPPTNIGIVGLGYVGLPLAIEFSKHFKTVGYDIDSKRIAQLKEYVDVTNECSVEELRLANTLEYSDRLNAIENCNFYIITVPTPIDVDKQPDLSYLQKSSIAIAGILKKDDIVVFESTVYPGATEEVCVPLLEQHSGLKYNEDFYVGYSPERINPGDKTNRLVNIKKITSGSNKIAAEKISSVYGEIIEAGIHSAPSIKVAEAAKVIENTQRDLNIALINELALIFGRLDIDTGEVLEAASTKWNFLPFKPGLVGGHCIGVDPYYLCHKAQAVGYIPDIILAGRRINDGMGSYVASSLVKKMIGQKKHVLEAKVLVLGFAFKEDCPDVRNTKVIDIVNEVQSYGAVVDVYDPIIDTEAAKDHYNANFVESISASKYDAVILAVSHQEFLAMGSERIRELCVENHVFYDVKSAFGKDDSDLRL